MQKIAACFIPKSAATCPSYKAQLEIANGGNPKAEVNAFFSVS